MEGQLFKIELLTSKLYQKTGHFRSSLWAVYCTVVSCHLVQCQAHISALSLQRACYQVLTTLTYKTNHCYVFM